MFIWVIFFQVYSSNFCQSSVWIMTMTPQKLFQNNTNIRQTGKDSKSAVSHSDQIQNHCF